MDVLIVGTGALATYFAACFSYTGLSVTMLGTWSEGIIALQQKGAILIGKGCFPVQVTNNPEEIQPTRIALVLVKSWQTQRASQQLKYCLAHDGLAVTFQNGLGNVDILQQVLGLNRVAQGVTDNGVTLLEPGVVTLKGQGSVTLQAHPLMAILSNMLDKAEIKSSIVYDITPFAWGKLVVNSSLNPLTAVLHLKNGELLKNPPAFELMTALVIESARVATSFGVRLPFVDPVQASIEVAKLTSENRSSMLQDIMRGSQTEIDAINGSIVRIGQEKNVDTPVNEVIVSLVKALHPLS